jgi:hypothetical protein
MADEGMNIPFNITGNADEKLELVNELVKLLMASIQDLARTSKSTKGGTKAVAEGARDTAKAVKDETRAVKRARQEMIKLKNERKKATRAAKDFDAQAERTGLALKSEVTALQQATTIIRKRAIEERKLQLLQRKGFDSTGRRIGQYKVEALAIDAVNKRLFKKALAEAVARKAMAQGIATAKERALIEGRTAAATAKTAAATDRAAAATRRYSNEVKRASANGNRAAFIFRRLFGVLAAFTAARFAITGFFAGVREAIEFNKNIQQAQLGIASLFLAVGQVRNEMGEVVEGAEGLAVAMKESKRQTELLRKDALSTAATFDELLQTFQVGLAPGLAAGLSPDEIRNLAIRISQAATAIGLPMNQLSEEIRSILAGTIQQRTTRIAAALGIRNEDIRNAKQAGQLFSFLSTKFDAFGVAGQKAMDQFFGIVTRVQDAFKQLLGAAGLGFFEQLQTLLRETFELVTDTRSLEIRPDPTAVRILQEIFDGFEGAARNVRDLTKSLSGEDLTAVASAIGTIIEVGSALLLGFLQGVIQAFGTIKDIAAPILAVFREVSDSIPGEEIREVVAALTEVITLMFVWKQIVLAIGFIQRQNLFTTKGLIGLLIISVFAAQRLLSKFLGIKDISFEDTFKVLTLEFQNAIELIIARAKVAFAKATDFVVNLLTEPLTLLKKLTLDTAEVILTALSFTSEAANDALQKVYKAQGVNQKEFADLSRKNAEQAEQELERVQAIAEARSAALIKQLREEADARKLADKAEVDKIKKAADFNGLISVGVQTLKAEAAVIERITTGLEEAQQKTAFRGAFGFEISGQTVTAVNAFNNAFADIRTAAKTINGQITQMSDGLQGVRANLEKAVEGSEEQKALLVQEIAFIEAINMLRAEGKLIEDTVLATTIAKLTVAREEWLVKSQIARLTSTQEFAAERAVLEARRQGASAAKITLIQINARIEALQREKELIRSRFAADILAQEKLLQFGNLTADQRTVAEKTILELYNQQAVALARLGIEIEGLADKAKVLGKEVEDSIIGGMERGFAQFALRFRSSFQAGVDIARSATESLANFISTSISDAFDPNSDTSLKQRFGLFLQEIANMIIQTLVRLAIAKAILGLFPGGSAGATAAAGVGGLAKGGLIKAFAPLMAHFSPSAQGLATGGLSRPKGLHPSDTIPIWAAKGEFMQCAAAVRTYGVGAMKAINDRLVDPMALKALTNSKGASRGSRNRSAGYAEGGPITEVVSPIQAEKSEDQNIGVNKDVPIAALIANETTLEKILAGGGGALHRWMQDNGYQPRGM